MTSAPVTTTPPPSPISDARPADPSGPPFVFAEPDLVSRFEAMAARHPDRAAIDSNGVTLTYAQLNAKANRIAHAILATVSKARKPVAAPQDTPLVALFVDQGIDLAAAVFGTLKAGCAYVPLDPTYPDNKNEHMLADARPAAMVTYAASDARADALTPTKLPKVHVEALPDSLAASNPGVAIEPHRLAYVLYTSGSTGKPKGVMQTHRSVLHNAAIHADAFGITHEDRQTLLYPCSVYGGVRDTYNALLNGAALHHYPVREAGYDGLTTWLAEHRISLYCSVASVFRHFARRLDESGEPANKNRYADLRIIKLGGEAPLPADIELYRNHFPDPCELSCGLGSTETGMSCRFPVMKDTTLEGPAIPLGKAVHGIEVLLLDENRQPVGESDIGEIAIRSRYITQGYLGRDDLNTTVFSIDEHDPDLRTFYTGDLAQRNGDGDFMHRGRKDHQVKVRGNRVELLEVEAALESHPSVRDAVVLAKTDDAGTVRLVAYLTLEENNGEPVTAHTMRDHLKNFVARFAIPNVYVHLGEIPLTPNGKRNRLALPEPEDDGLTLLSAGGEKVAAANELEEKIARAFARALNGKESSDDQFRGGVTDSFFDLGGDSLQAVGLVLGIEKEVGKRIELAALISHPSVRALAELLDGDTSALNAASHAPVVTFHPRSEAANRPPLFTISGQGGSVLCYHDLARRLPDDQPVYGLQLPGINADEEVLDDVRPVAAELISRMQTVQPTGSGPYRLLGYSFGAVVAFEMAQQLEAAGQAVDYLGVIDCQAPQTRRPASKVTKLKVHLRDFMQVNTAGKVRFIKDRLAGRQTDVAEYQVTQPDHGYTPEMVERLNRLSSASRRAYKAYRPERQEHTAVTLFKCEERHGWMDFFEDQPDRGWGNYAPMKNTFAIPGKHLEVFRAEYGPKLAEQVTKSLLA